MVSMSIENGQDYKTAFGAFLRNKRLAQSKKVKQSEVLKHLPGWSAASYSRLEDGITAPNFDDLLAIHRAFRTAGISFYQGNGIDYQKHMLRTIPAPTSEEMHYVISRIRHYTLQGLLSEKVKEASERFLQVCEQCGISFDLSYTEEEKPELLEVVSFAPYYQQVQMVSAQAAKRFFEAVFQKNDCTGWQVALDPSPENTRIEQGLQLTAQKAPVFQAGDEWAYLFWGLGTGADLGVDKLCD